MTSNGWKIKYVKTLVNATNVNSSTAVTYIAFPRPKNSNINLSPPGAIS